MNEQLSLQWLRQNISNHLLSRLIFNIDLTAFHSIMYEEETYVDVSRSARVGPAVLHHCNGRHIVLKNCSRWQLVALSL